MRKTAILLTLLTAASLPTLADNAENEFNRSTATLSAELLSRSIQESATGRAVDQEALRQDMTARPSEHAERAASEQLARELAVRELDKWYRAEVSRALRRLESAPGKAVTLPQTLKDAALSLPPAVATLALERNFPAAFAAARAKACEEQRSQLVTDLFPNETELENVPRAELAKSLAERIVAKQRGPVFEENRAFIGEKFVAPALDDAERQRQVQLDAARLAPEAKEAFLPEDFAAMVNRNVEDAARSYKLPGPQFKRYGVFPAAVKEAALTADLAALAKFATAAEAMRFPVTEGEIAAAIKANLKAQRLPDDSRRLVAKQELPQLAEAAVKNYLQQAPGTQRERLRRFLEAKAMAIPELEALATRCVEPEFPQARRKVTAEQRAQWFRPLEGLAWTPPEKMVEAYYKNNDKAFERDSAKLPGLASGDPPSGTLLQETETGLRQDVGATFAQSRKALARQMALSEQLQQQLSDAVGSDGSPGFLTRLLVGLGLDDTQTLPTVEALAARYQQVVEARWAKERVATVWGAGPKPINYKEKLLELFPMVKEDILRRTKAILKEKTVEEKPERKKLSDKKEPPVVKTNVKVEIDYADGLITARLSRDGQELPQAYSLSASPADYEAGEAKLLQELGETFAAALQDKRGGAKEMKVKVSIMVYNGMVYYRFVSNLRQRLHAEAEKLKRAGLDVSLEDRLYKR